MSDRFRFDAKVYTASFSIATHRGRGGRTCDSLDAARSCVVHLCRSSIHPPPSTGYPSEIDEIKLYTVAPGRSGCGGASQAFHAAQACRWTRPSSLSAPVVVRDVAATRPARVDCIPLPGEPGWTAIF